MPKLHPAPQSTEQLTAVPEQPILPSKQEMAFAAEVTRILLEKINTPALESALFSQEPFLSLITRWMNPHFQAFISRATLADRQNILQHMDRELQNYHKAQTIRSQIVIPGVPKPPPQVKLDLSTANLVMGGLLELMKTLPPPQTQFSTEASASENQSPPVEREGSSETHP
jgi:hypothetical protein